MSFNPNLNYGDEIDNKTLSKIFKCSVRGGMRRSKETNTLVLISKRIKPIYNDRREGSKLFYTGMGLAGNQSLDFSQNKTLYQSNENGIDVYLFEVNEPGIYKYMGKVILEEKPFQEEQEDIKGNKRNVWIFPLRLIDYPEEPLITEEEFIKKQEELEKTIKKLSREDIENKVKQSSGKSKLKRIATKVYERDPYVSLLAKINANGICQLCGEEAPFENKEGEPYLEVHHIEWLSKGGKDIIENTVALCPNCHKKMHVLNLNKDKNTLFDLKNGV